MGHQNFSHFVYKREPLAKTESWDFKKNVIGINDKLKSMNKNLPQQKYY